MPGGMAATERTMTATISAIDKSASSITFVGPNDWKYSRRVVEPKVFDLLVYLIRHRDRVLSREELFREVWDGREVSDATLSNHVKSARKILGDSGELQKTILTIRGRGYQFIAPVTVIPETGPQPDTAHVATPAVPARRLPSRRSNRNRPRTRRTSSWFPSMCPAMRPKRGGLSRIRSRGK